jgi:acyl-CoA synthetase (AMP-forming)/AMP-acid ligase II
VNIVTATQTIQDNYARADRRTDRRVTLLKAHLEEGRFPDPTSLGTLASLRIQKDQWGEAVAHVHSLRSEKATVANVAKILRELAKEAAERAMYSAGSSDGFWRAQIEARRMGWAQFYRQATELAEQLEAQ